MDNFGDVLMSGSEAGDRYLGYGFSDRRQLVAEHGFSALLTVESDGRRSSVLSGTVVRFWGSRRTGPPLRAASGSRAPQEQVRAPRPAAVIACTRHRRG